jgi:Cytochrome b(C-terminal)/b6/petD
VNRAEKEAYLRDYEVAKKKGKPFFPYAVMKDTTMMLIVALVIVGLSILLGAEQGPKVDPTTTTYTPRPDWYFYFLFELLRVLKPPWATPIATVGIPTLCMVLLLMLPFFDRNSERRIERRPIALTAGVLVIIAMAYLTFLGARAAEPGRPEDHGRARTGQAGGGAVRLPRLSQAGRQRQQRSRPRADRDRGETAPKRDRALAPGRAEHHALLRRPAAREVPGPDRVPRLAPLAPPRAAPVEVTSNR